MKTRDDVIADIKARIAADPQAAKKKIIGAGSRSYSLEDILKEIEDDTTIGKLIVAGWLKLANAKKTPTKK